ncbi:MAG: phosphoribosylformylglycinamidine synthase [Clostridiales bacterium]|nr:phosphoribosylformylglycinamidine synthase [Clostridiales bacterium]
MAEIKRIYVEKREGCNIEAQSFYADLKENLELKGLKGVRILIRYDIEGISGEYFDECKNTIFSEPPVDILYEEKYEKAGDEISFAVEYLPGQFDQRADSAMQCVQIVTGEDRPLINCAKVYVLKGDLTEEEVAAVKKYCINPVDSREAALEKPKSLKLEHPEAEDVKVFDGFTEMSEEEIIAMRQSLGLAMSDEDLLFCQEYFRDTEKRNPTVTEIRVIDTYWSDHCRHTTFATNLQNVEIEESKYKAKIEEAFKLYLSERERLGRTKPVCLMDIATQGVRSLKEMGKLSALDESEEINACSIEAKVEVDGKEEDFLIMFKNETHNHPTEIEPFGGAATCLGGAIRDPLSGRAYVYQAMRVTGCADPRKAVKDTLAGKLPQRKLTRGAAAGYSSYGNQIGLATGQVVEIYDEGYVAKRMEIGAVIAAAKKENVIRLRPEAGDVIIMTGGRAGRDGCGGATGSSKEHTEDSINTCGAEVQKGNAPTERKLQRLFRNDEAAKMIKRCNDFGAGGISVAIGELADGLVVDLDKVPKKYEGLDGTEIAISESQERMAVVIDKENADKFIEIANRENLEATAVAVVTDDRRLKMIWRGKPILDISRDFLDTNGVMQKADVLVKAPAELKQTEPEGADIKEKWLNNLRDLNVAAQKGLSERFDSTIGAGTVLMPFGGKNQLTPVEAMAAKVPVLKGETDTVTLMSFGYNPKPAKASPFHGAVYAVVESVAKIVAAGGSYENIYLTFQEYFEHLGKVPEKWGKPFAALMGGFLAQMELGLGAIGGKDSMSGTFMDLTVPPTLVSFAVDVDKVQNVISPEFKKAGSVIARINAEYDENDLPVFEALKEEFAKITDLIRDKKIISASTIGQGGAAACISKMVFGNDIGADVKIGKPFDYSYGSFIVEIDGSKAEAEEALQGLSFEILGETFAENKIIANGSEISGEEAKKIWIKPIEKVFPTKLYDDFSKKDITLKSFSVIEKAGSGKGIAAPRVVIPVFPGTNCEYDTMRRFEKAGAKVETFVIRNLKTSWLKESAKALAELINNSQIVMLPGGFSAGDEPEGSGKFIAAVFRNPEIKEAVTELLNNRDGLMLGICNGFQALIKLGLVPYGEIRDIESTGPTLSFNTIGRHVSCLANTKIVSNKSPWLWNTTTGDMFNVPVSHGEGRFLASEAVVRELEANGQIATQYVDFNGNPSYDIKYNVNGSLYAIEGITSPDGRVLGKMGHSERIGSGLYKNVPGEKDQLIFEAGVGYFK